MKLTQLRNSFIQELETLYPKAECEAFFYRLSETILKLNRLDIALNSDTVITEASYLEFKTALRRLKTFEPIQYIIGSTEFYGLEFKVREGVLIPRPETEELVDWIVSDNNINKSPMSILDIGTGSGCIPISLFKTLKNALVSSVDVSNEAIKIAKENAMELNAAISFYQFDVLDKKSWTSLGTQVFDILVSNPPYVCNSEKALMESNVLDYEPKVALFVDDDNPLQFYKAILELSKTYLKDNGKLYFEINEALGMGMLELFKDYEFKDVELRKDSLGKDRMIKGIKK